MTRRVRTVLSSVLGPVVRPLRRRPLVVPAVLFLLVLAVGLSNWGRPVGDRRAAAGTPGQHAWLAGAQTLPSAPPSAADDDPDGGDTPSDTPSTLPTPTGGSGQLPRGGTTLFPRYRLVGYAGGPHTAAFGRLGIGDLDARVAEID